jgi:hypothetical protein
MLRNYYANQKLIVIMLHYANSEPGGKNGGLYCGKYPLMVVSAVLLN